jgi:hypothetical protein
VKALRSLKLTLTGDTDAAKLFEQVFDRQEDVATVVAWENSGIRRVAAAAIGAAIPFGGITTASMLLIASDKDIVVRINGGAENIAVKKATAGRGVFYLEGAVTSVVIDNPGTEDATIVYALAGV